MLTEDFDVKDFFKKLKRTFQNTKFEKAFNEIEEEINRNIFSDEGLKRYGFSGEQGRIKKWIFESAHKDWESNKKNSKILKKLLSISEILLKSLSHVHPIFEALNELVQLFKIHKSNDFHRIDEHYRDVN
jgi:hypothetical protein